MANYTEPYHLYKQINDFSDDNYFNKKVQQVISNFPIGTPTPTVAQIKTTFTYYLSYCTFTQNSWRNTLTIDKFFKEEETDILAVTTLSENVIKLILTILLNIFNKE